MRVHSPSLTPYAMGNGGEIMRDVGYALLFAALILVAFVLSFVIGGFTWAGIGVYLINPTFALTVTAKQWFVGGGCVSLLFSGATVKT